MPDIGKAPCPGSAVRSDAGAVRLRNSGILALSGILIAGVVLRFWNFDSLSITYDELLTGIFNVRAPNLLTYQSLVNMGFPEQAPGFYGLQYFWTNWFGFSITSLRLLPLTSAVIAMPLSYIVASRLYGRTAGIIAAMCFALSPMNIWWSQGSRAHTLMPLFGMLCLYTFMQLQEKNSWKWGSAHLVVVLLGLWTSLTVVFLVAAELCFLFLSARGRVRQAIGWGAALCAVLVPTMVWVRLMPHYASKGAGQPDPARLLSAIIGSDSMHLNIDIPQPFFPSSVYSLDLWMNYGLAAFYVVALVWLLNRAVRSAFWRSRDDRSDLDGKRSLLLFLIILVPPVLAYLAAAFLGRDLLFPRYTMYSLPALYAALGGFTAAISRAWLRKVVIAILLGLYVYQIPFLIPTTRRADWLSAGEYVRAHATTEDIVLAVGEFFPGEIFDINMRWGNGALHIPVFTAATLQSAVDGTLYCLAYADPEKPPKTQRAVWLLFQRGDGITPECPELNAAFDSLGLAYDGHAVVAGDTIFVYRVHLRDEEPFPENPENLAPVRVAEPDTQMSVDCDTFAGSALPEGMDSIAGEGDAKSMTCGVLQRVALRMYRDPMDPMMWASNLIAAGKPELALSMSDVSLKMSANYSLGHFVRGLALENLGRHDEARAAINQAFAGNFFLKRVLSPYIGAILDAKHAEEMRAALQELEAIGVVWFTPALWSLYHRRFDGQSGLLPVGIYAPREEYYQAWLDHFGSNPRQAGPLSRRANTHLQYMLRLSNLHHRGSQ